MPSSASANGDTAEGKRWSLMLNTASTCCGCCRKLTLRSSSSVTNCAAWLLSFHCSVAKIIFGVNPAFSRSPTTFGPSATKAPSLLRCFFISSCFTYFICPLLIMGTKIRISEGRTKLKIDFIFLPSENDGTYEIIYGTYEIIYGTYEIIYGTYSG